MKSVYVNEVSVESAAMLEKAKKYLQTEELTEYYLALESAVLYYNPEAEFLLGLCYLNGIGVPIDNQLAFKYFLSAAEHGYIKANVYVAFYYISEYDEDCIGEFGEKTDYEAAISWLLPAAKQEEPYAQYILWWIAAIGNGDGVHKEEAYQWLAKSAEQGFAKAEYHIGLEYCSGKNLELNRELGIVYLTRALFHGMNNAIPELANAWHAIAYEEKDTENKRIAEYNTLLWANKAYSMGYDYMRLVIAIVRIYGVEDIGDKKDDVAVVMEFAEKNDTYAQKELANCYHLGIGVEKNTEKVYYWLEKAALGGLASAAAKYGVNYRKGIEGLEIDVEKAKFWLEKAADMKYANAMIHLGAMYYNNELPQDYERAFSYFNMALEYAERTDVKSSLYSWLALCYASGNGTLKNWEKSIYYAEKAAECGDPVCQYELAVDYGYRSNTPDYERAVYWFAAAAKQGHVDAQVKLGYYYHVGRGVTKNYTKALYWFRVAAEQGNSHAMNNIGDAYYHGYGVKKDKKMGIEWIRRAAEAGNEVAIKWLQKKKLY